MLCVTGNEASVEDLAGRLADVSRRLPDVLQEVRLDALARPGEALALVQQHAGRLVVCCRPTRQGGGYRGSETDRLNLLQHVAGSGLAYLDVEADVPDSALQCLRSAGCRSLLLSWHAFDGFGSRLDPWLDALRTRPAECVKLAIQVDQAADLVRLSGLAGGLGRQSVVVGMGPGGTLSRTRYPYFGSAWTYVSADPGKATAPGQLSLTEALAMDLPGSASRPFVALVGGPAAQASPGPRVYNRFFRKQDLPYSYCLALTNREPETVFALLARMGALGASVTMPHKPAALAYADRADEPAGRTGAANSLRFDADACQASNTDVAGVREPLRRALAGSKPKQVLVLGAGGAARAAVLACAQLGLPVWVAARNPERAQKALGPSVKVLNWKDRIGAAADVLINATGLPGDHPDLWTGALNKRLVFDLTVSATSSDLLRRAVEQGSQTLDAMAMWLAQGARQMSFITGHALSVADLEDCLP